MSKRCRFELTVMVAVLLGTLMCYHAVHAQVITRFKNGYLTFTNENPALYYRVEFKPNLTDPVEWDGVFRGLRNIQSSNAEITVPVGMFYRVVGRDTPWVAGTAGATDILSGKTAYVNDEEVTGTMTSHTGNVTAQSREVSGTTLRFRPQAGYYTGSAANSVQWSDANFTAANIRSGVSMFGRTGTLTPASGNAGPGDVRLGRTFSSDAGASTGTMPDRTGHVTAQERRVSGTTLQLRPQAGYYTGSAANSVQWSDANFTAANIRSGVSIFGVSGTHPIAGVPKTGQTISARSGDDGHLRKGVAWPSPRFTDHGNTVTDNLTGLMWTKNANLPGGTRSWNAAIDYCNNMNPGAGTYGYTDWRLPNVLELQSLIDYTQDEPALPAGHPFTGVQLGSYWSSTPQVGLTFGYPRWAVSLRYGHVQPDDRTGTHRVWPVRGGQ